MKRMMLVLGMAATIMTCSYLTINEITEVEVVNEQTEEFASKEARFVHICYPAVECILGEEIHSQKVEYDDNGFYIDNRFISFDEIDAHIIECDGDHCI